MRLRKHIPAAAVVLFAAACALGQTAVSPSAKKPVAKKAVVHHSSTAHVAAAKAPVSRAKSAPVTGHVATAKTQVSKSRPGAPVSVAVSGTRRRHYYGERFTASSFTNDLTSGDVTEGEDPVVRAAAIQALGNMNGTALAIDPSSGRILAMVNQHLALSAGAEPCSTIKVAVALAALKEGLIKADTPVNLGGHYSLDLTHALAKSVNLYFEVLGRAMGFERVKQYESSGWGSWRGTTSRASSWGRIRTRSCRWRRAVWGGCARSARASA